MGFLSFFLGRSHRQCVHAPVEDKGDRWIILVPSLCASFVFPTIRSSVSLWIMRFKGPHAVVAARVLGVVQGYVRNLGRIRFSAYTICKIPDRFRTRVREGNKSSEFSIIARLRATIECAKAGALVPWFSAGEITRDEAFVKLVVK